MQDSVVIDSFFREFSKLDTESVGAALRSLSPESASVEDVEYLLDFDARLKLVERLAFSRAVPPPLMIELEGLLLRAAKLHEAKQELARNLAVTRGATGAPQQRGEPRPRKQVKARTAKYAKLEELAQSVPPVSQVADYVAETLELQRAFHTVVERLDRDRQSGATRA